MKLRTRLQRLERLVVSDRGCAACRHRRERIALVDITQTADGSVAYSEDAPLLALLVVRSRNSSSRSWRPS